MCIEIINWSEINVLKYFHEYFCMQSCLLGYTYNVNDLKMGENAVKMHLLKDVEQNAGIIIFLYLSILV